MCLLNWFIGFPLIILVYFRQSLCILFEKMRFIGLYAAYQLMTNEILFSI